MASPQEMEAAMVRNIEEKTGKSLDAWVKLAKKAKLSKHGQIVKHLKGEGLTHGYANLVAHHALGGVPSTVTGDDALVDAQYAGAKADLRPIYDALVKAVRGFGKDVEIAPKKAYVSLRRSKQFGLIQPSTKTRVDVGINRKGAKAKGRLEASGSFNSMVSHRVRVSDASEVNGELVGWLKDAYEDA